MTVLSRPQSGKRLHVYCARKQLTKQLPPQCVSEPTVGSTLGNKNGQNRIIFSLLIALLTFLPLTSSSITSLCWMCRLSGWHHQNVSYTNVCTTHLHTMCMQMFSISITWCHRLWRMVLCSGVSEGVLASVDFGKLKHLFKKTLKKKSP